jgi:ATP-dependent helicase/nuclease subunit A
MLDRFLDSQIWEEVQHAEPVYTEYPLAREVRDNSDPAVRRGVIDLAYRTEDGWVLVDYKSDCVYGPPADALTDDHPYAQQIRTYAESWTAVLGEPVHRAGLWFADTGAHVVVVGPEADA